MNFREGMRRLGLLLGALGGLLGGFVAYSDAHTLWGVLTAHRKFESVMALPTLQKIAKDPYGGKLVDEVGGRRVQDKPEILSVEQSQKLYGAGKYRVETTKGVYQIELKVSHREVTSPKTNIFGDPIVGFVPDPADWKTVSEGDEQGGMWIFPAHPMLERNSDGVERVHLDSTKRVVGVILSGEELVTRTDLPGLGAYLMVLGCPLVGFLLSWGGVRIIAWVGSGFFQARSD